MDLHEKVALITGASAGIGEACAHAFARRGARLILTARSADALERVCRAVSPAKAVSIPSDLTRPAEIAVLAERAAASFGRVDILINNAGVGLYTPSWQAKPDLVRQMMEVNFFAPIELIRLLVPGMRRQGGGVIVNVSSIAGKIPLPWLTHYSASKAALNFVSDALRMELRGTGIRVVAVCPGYVSTGFAQHVLGGQVPRAVASRRHFTITPERCALAVVRGVEKEKRTVVTPWTGWPLIALARVLPWPVHAVMARMRAPDLA